jgi:hypothetical protein
MSNLRVEALVPEFEGVQLGDKRLEARVLQTVQALALKPAASILEASRSAAEAEAMYRLLRNPRVSMEAILQPHLEKTQERCVSLPSVLVIHDTSYFQYRGEERRDLGRLRTETSQGFLFHASLAVEAGTRQPLGLIAGKVWTRSFNRSARIEGRKGPRKASGSDYARIGNKESDRWDELIRDSSEHLKCCRKIVHVADREADFYSLFASLRARGDSFVIRLARDKKVRKNVEAESETVIETASRAAGRVEIEIPLSRRSSVTMPAREKTFGPREARTARVEFAAATAEIRAPRYIKAPPSLRINVVHVRELEPPRDADAVEWFLLTSEPIDSESDLRNVVEIYRARWLIEEFFKALKTGCAMEKRELESLHTLTNALALCIPIAHHLIALRHFARSKPSGPASIALSPTQVAILQAKARLPANPTVLQALVAVAYLGGHYTPFAKKPPGWRILARGMERLLALEDGWLARGPGDPIKR